MFAKTILAALVLVGASLTFVADASAAPAQAGYALRYGSVHQASPCPPNHSLQECFYN